MNKIELLAPAKDLEKAKIAIMYGADAVYVGGKSFSLRSRASNFSISDLKNLVEYAKFYNAKVYVTVNIVFHDEDFYGIKEYLRTLEAIGVNAIIVSSPAVISLVKSVAPELECHVSTQMSVVNSGAVHFLEEVGVDRVILGRECPMSDIEQICAKCMTPIEVFIHGGMCSNYSGRCILSNRMTNRDANRGGCAHSCRWKYDVYEGKEKISLDDCPFSMSSKDLRASAYVERMIKAGVASLKIEGRMKSEYYLAQVVRTYRRMIDEIYKEGSLSKERIAYYDEELSKAENRPSDDGFLSGMADNSKHLYGVNGAGVTHDYVAYVLGYDSMRSMALVEVKNRFSVNDELEAFGPYLENRRFTNKVMFKEDMTNISLANQPTERVFIRTPFPLHKHDMIRRVRYDED